MNSTVNPYDVIPAELKALPNWVCFCIEKSKDDKPTKVPYQANDLKLKASSTDAATWTTFGKAVAASPRFDGLGFMFSGSGYAGIDLDHCVGQDGVLEEWAETIVDSFATYSEFSVSRTGVHLICKGQLDGPGRKHGGIEAYCRARYFTMSGAAVPGSVPTIEDRQDELTAFVARVFPTKTPQDAPRRAASAPSSLSDTDLLTKAQGAKNGAAFSALWRGDVSGYQFDASRADLALCTHLAFWFGNDGAAIDRLFRLSGLYREDKWGSREDYRERTISRALACTSKTYSPPGFDATAGFGKSRAESPQEGAQSASGSGGQSQDEGALPVALPVALPGVMPLVAQKMAGLPVDVLHMGLRVHDGASAKDLREILQRLIKVKNVAECPLNFSFGDAYNALPAKYGARGHWARVNFGQGYEMQMRKWGHVAGQWPQEIRRPGIPWSFYAEGAKLPLAEKKLMLDKHDKGARPTIGEVRAKAAEGKTKPLPQNLKSALLGLIEERGEAFVKGMLQLERVGALDELLGAANSPQNEAAENAPKNAKSDDFPSKHCSESEQCLPPNRTSFSDDFEAAFADEGAPAEAVRSASAGSSHRTAGEAAATRSARECGHTAERFTAAAESPPECCAGVTLPDYGASPKDAPKESGDGAPKSAPSDVLPPLTPFAPLIAAAEAGKLAADNRLFVLNATRDPAPSPRLLAQLAVLQAALPTVPRREVNGRIWRRPS